jgi:anti-anti-sigma regulatory factor
MNALVSHSSKIDGVMVFDLALEDLEDDNACQMFCEQTLCFASDKVIINLSKCEVITSDVLKRLEDLVSAITIVGNQVIVCGFNPVSAAMLFAFVDDLNFTTELDIDRALQALSNNQSN